MREVPQTIDDSVFADRILYNIPPEPTCRQMSVHTRSATHHMTPSFARQRRQAAAALNVLSAKYL